MRRKARTRWERAAQVLNWLTEEFDLPGNPFIAVVDAVDGDESFGEVKLRGDRFAVCLSRRLCRSVAQTVETTVHEAAHIRLYRDGIGLYHGPKFWRAYGEMIDAFNNYGFQDSLAFPLE